MTKVVAFAGNPNVGKSTVFNAITGMKQHTGNWPGKTVEYAVGRCRIGTEWFQMVDLPGCYSLYAQSEEERVARDYICLEQIDVVVVVCDATCLERNLNLVLQILEVTPKVVVCVNLLDEAKKKGIQVDLEVLSKCLQVPTVGVVARSKEGISELLEVIRKEAIEDREQTGGKYQEDIEEIYGRAKKITDQVVTYNKEQHDKRDRQLDQFFTGKWTGFLTMFALLFLIFWITIVGANYPSMWLASVLEYVEKVLVDVCVWIHVPEWIYEPLIYGVYGVLSWVVAVMLPPMTIFFPLFTLLEDFGYLPRVAFNMDKCFCKCHACGKQALTMCMGFGCNAVGVTGCRIIDSKRERFIAILTNSFVPCNGRFPTIIAVITMFLVGEIQGDYESVLSAVFLAGVLVFSVGITLLVSYLLSKTVLKGEASSFTLELPPYRRPQVGSVIVRSLLDRTIFVLGRAIMVAAPIGLCIWLMANIPIGTDNLLSYSARMLEPMGQLMGLDGVILLGFILGFPANEIVIPIILMTYLMQGNLVQMDDLSVMKEVLVTNGWTWVTACNVILFSLLHWPCGTTLLTIKKETNSLRWTALSFILPTLIGVLICMLTTYIFV